MGDSPGQDGPMLAIDIWRSANLLLKQHGLDAPINAAMRADAALAKGDIDGFRVWCKILDAIDRLSGQPGDAGRPQTMH